MDNPLKIEIEKILTKLFPGKKITITNNDGSQTISIL